MVIYGIENEINGKLYVGQSKREFIKRKYEHKRKLKSGIHYNTHLQNSWNKYGENNFNFFILESGFSDHNELDNAEIFWITFLRTYLKQSGYNLTRKANGVRKFSKESIRKISKNNPKYWLGKKLSDDHIQNAVNNRDYKSGKNHPRYGTSLSEETKNKISKSRKGNYKGEKNPFYGKTHTDEVKNILSKNNSKPVYQFDKKGNFIKEWNSITKAENELKIHNIIKCCKGKNKSSGGYYWKYKYDSKGNKNNKTIDVNKLKPKRTNKIVLQKNKNGEIIKEWFSITEASEHMDVCISTISRWCKNNKMYRGYKWELK